MSIQDIAALTGSVNNLVEEVSGKMSAIDSKVAQADAAFRAKAESLTITANLGYSNAVERPSGGRNTMRLDEQGNENIMVVIPKFRCEDINAAILARTGVDMQLGTGTHPAFRTNGVDRREILVGKYLASSGKSGGCSVIGGVQPRTSVNYGAAKSLSVNKGENWHMMSVHEWAAISLWSLANDTVPRGNTYYGSAHDARHEVGVRTDGGGPGDAIGVPRTLTGSGPVTWSHDHSAYGVQDLVGNVSEWIDQLRCENGRIITTLDNDYSILDEYWTRHPVYFDSPVDAETGSGSAGAPVLSNTVINRNGPLGDNGNDYPHLSAGNISTIGKSADYDGSELMRRLLIEFSTPMGGVGGVWVRNYGSRYPRKGGDWADGSTAGVASLFMSSDSLAAFGDIGFRPALFV